MTLREDPLANAFEALAVGPDAFVLAQEARGQAKIATNDVLPKDGNWDKLEALGFVRGEPVEGDDLFVHGSIPPGWSKRRTDHSLYTDIVDERGVKRAHIGYKAAFYDRWASITAIDVSNDLATQLGYGDELKLPDTWSVLTDEEKQNTLVALYSRLQERAEFVERYNKDDDPYYTDQIARFDAAVKLVEANLG